MVSSRKSGVIRAQRKLLNSRERLVVLLRCSTDPTLSQEKRRVAGTLAQSQLAAVILGEKALRHAWRMRAL
jgi:hypothetical protein